MRKLLPELPTSSFKTWMHGKELEKCCTKRSIQCIRCKKTLCQEDEAKKMTRKAANERKKESVGECPGRGSNSRPSDYETDALPTEPPRLHWMAIVRKVSVCRVCEGVSECEAERKGREGEKKEKLSTTLEIDTILSQLKIE